MAGPHGANIQFQLSVDAIEISEAVVAHRTACDGAVEFINRHQTSRRIVDLSRILKRRTHHGVTEQRPHQIEQFLLHRLVLVDLRGNKAQEFERSEGHTSELQSLMRISYAVFCLKKKNKKITDNRDTQLTS